MKEFLHIQADFGVLGIRELKRFIIPADCGRQFLTAFWEISVTSDCRLDARDTTRIPRRAISAALCDARLRNSSTLFVVIKISRRRSIAPVVNPVNMANPRPRNDETPENITSFQHEFAYPMDWICPDQRLIAVYSVESSSACWTRSWNTSRRFFE